MTFGIDLDAARRERQHPDGIPLTFKGESYTLPAELPLDVFDPFLDEEFDLAGLIRDALQKAQEPLETGGTRGAIGAVIDLLFVRPDLPLDIINRIFAAYEGLFGAEQYARFKAGSPALQDYGVLTSQLITFYGVGLGEAFASLVSSGDAGETPQPTSSASTGSTSATPSDLGRPLEQHERLSMEEEMRLLEQGDITADLTGSSESDGSTSSSMV